MTVRIYYENGDGGVSIERRDDYHTTSEMVIAYDLLEDGGTEYKIAIPLGRVLKVTG